MPNSCVDSAHCNMCRSYVHQKRSPKNTALQENGCMEQKRVCFQVVAIQNVSCKEKRFHTTTVNEGPSFFKRIKPETHGRAGFRLRGGGGGGRLAQGLRGGGGDRALRPDPPHKRAQLTGPPESYRD